MKHNYFTHSSYERRENDHYPTVDRRCMKALLNTWDFPLPAIEHFAGATRLQFRPYWSSERKHSPIHSYQWLVWKHRVDGFPVLKYDKGE